MSKVHSETSLNDLVGEDFGPYRLLRRLGVGGMAETYEAIRRGPSGFTQHVCLKLVLPFFREKEDFIFLFEREARLAAKLRHSNIVGIIDFGAIEGVPYMALELVDGADLRVLLDGQDGKRLSPELVALIGHELAAALEHAHSPRSQKTSDGNEDSAIVHRDVSPSNVLVSRNGEVFLSDFGVAKAMSGTSRQQSAVKGKVPYMSPEQLRAETLDGRADLFALGVVLFEALAGQRPYEGAHDPGTIMLILAGDRPSLQGLAPNAPAGLCELIESLLEPERSKRPASASALIDLLDEFVPSPRARRRLGEKVDECRPAQPRLSTAEALGLAGSPDAAAAAESDPVDTGVHRTASANLATDAQNRVTRKRGAGKKSRRKIWGALGVALLLLSVVAVGGTFWRSAGSDAAVAEAEANPDTVPPVAVGQPVEPEEAPETETAGARAASSEATPPSRPAFAPSRPSKLTVIVFPWGKVWINGKPQGPAPLKSLELKPGRYKVSAGQASAKETKTIRLRSGQERTLEFDLTQ